MESFLNRLSVRIKVILWMYFFLILSLDSCIGSHDFLLQNHLYKLNTRKFFSDARKIISFNSLNQSFLLSPSFLDSPFPQLHGHSLSCLLFQETKTVIFLCVHKTIWNEPKNSRMLNLSLSGSFLLFRQHLLSINDLITTELFGQSIDNHQRKQLFDKS